MLINTHTHRQLHDAEIEVVNIEPGEEVRSQWFSCGVHPWHVSEMNEEALIAGVNKLAKSGKCLAIGECGLDRLGKASMDVQERFFTRQIQIANEVKKPLLIHCVRAFNELLNCIHLAGNKMPLIVHGFNNNENVARLLADEGFYFSFGKALLGYDSNAARAIRAAGRRKILLETDNAEVEIRHVYRKASELLGVDGAILEAQVQHNFETAFNVSL